MSIIVSIFIGWAQVIFSITLFSWGAQLGADLCENCNQFITIIDKLGAVRSSFSTVLGLPSLADRCHVRCVREQCHVTKFIPHPTFVHCSSFGGLQALLNEALRHYFDVLLILLGGILPSRIAHTPLQPTWPCRGSTGCCSCSPCRQPQLHQCFLPGLPGRPGR